MHTSFAPVTNFMQEILPNVCFSVIFQSLVDNFHLVLINKWHSVVYQWAPQIACTHLQTGKLL